MKMDEKSGIYPVFNEVTGDIVGVFQPGSCVRNYTRPTYVYDHTPTKTELEDQSALTPRVLPSSRPRRVRGYYEKN
jgi:hypothetical protein